jgi:hypothetical protein
MRALSRNRICAHEDRGRDDCWEVDRGPTCSLDAGCSVLARRALTLTADLWTLARDARSLDPPTKIVPRAMLSSQNCRTGAISRDGQPRAILPRRVFLRRIADRFCGMRKPPDTGGDNFPSFVLDALPSAIGPIQTLHSTTWPQLEKDAKIKR